MIDNETIEYLNSYGEDIKTFQGCVNVVKRVLNSDCRMKDNNRASNCMAFKNAVQTLKNSFDISISTKTLKNYADLDNSSKSNHKISELLQGSKAKLTLRINPRRYKKSSHQEQLYFISFE